MYSGKDDHTRDLRSLLTDDGSMINPAGAIPDVPYVFSAGGAPIFALTFRLGGTNAGTVLRIVPALMRALTRMRPHPGLGLGDEERVLTRCRRQLADQVLGDLPRDFPRLLDESGQAIPESSIPGEELLLLAMMPDGDDDDYGTDGGVPAASMPFLSGLFNEALDRWVPYSFTWGPDSIIGAISDFPLPEPFRAVIRLAGCDAAVRNTGLVRPVLAMMALAASPAGSTGTVADMMAEDLLAQGRLAQMYVKQRGRASCRLSGPGTLPRWFTHIPADAVPLLLGFTRGQARVFLSRVPGAGGEAGALLLSQLVASGEVSREQARVPLADVPSWLCGTGLLDWISERMSMELPPEVADRVCRDAAAAGCPPSAAGWLEFFRRFDELGELPASWWAPIVS